MGLGVVGLVWILALTATARTVRRRVLARVVGDRGGPGADVSTVPRTVTVDQPSPTDEPTTDLPAVTLRDLDDEALCLAWRRSFVRLQQAPSLSARLRHVQERQRLLDELERRNPDGLAAWLASGCRAAGNPLPFLARSRSRAGQENGSTDNGNGSESDGDEGSSRAS
jgi:hypothetical protein